MENPQNMASKQFVHYAAALFMLSAAVVLVVGLFQPSWNKNIKAEITNQPYARTVTVTSDGKITAKPDTATIQLAVVSQGTTVKQVTTDNNQKMGSLIDAVKKLGVNDKDIATTRYDLSPQYRYPETRSPQIIGYELTQEVTIKVRDGKFDLVDDILDSGTKAGANQIGQLSFDIDDTSIVKKAAREKAFAVAKAKAQDMAASLGVRLGRVVTFSEGVPYSQPIYNQISAMDAAEAKVGSGASIQPGSKELSVEVSVTYEIE